VVLLIFLVWFGVKIVRMQGWHVFSWPFIIGTPAIGLGIFGALWARYVAGLVEFQALTTAVNAPTQPLIDPRPLGDTSRSLPDVHHDDRLQSDLR
jgi:hypothetical protein